MTNNVSNNEDSIVQLPDVIVRPLDYVEQLETRELQQIRRVVIHATELPDLNEARVYGQRVLYENSGTGNSGHFYIDRDGSVEQWVPLERVANHVRGHNPDSIGIELVNRGRYPDWLASDSQDWPDPYTEVQIVALIQLLQVLDNRLPDLVGIVGHEHLDKDRVPASDDPTQQVQRKTDPGPAFPWARVVEQSGLERADSAD